MGHAVGRTLGEHGHDVITCLAGRSERSRSLAAAAGIHDVEDLAALVCQADLVLSILPPASAVDAAGAVAEAMRLSGAAPPYADCNAVSPATARVVGAVISDAGANFIDAGIIGSAPGRGTPPRFYVSGSDTRPMEALDGKGISVKPIGTEVGRASAIKMCYAALTKGTFTLHTAVLIAAEVMGLTAELREELLFSQKDVYARMQAIVPRLPADSARWIGEMEEIARTIEAAGVTPKFHEAAAEIFRLLAQTPFAAETRETMDTDRGLEESVRVYAARLSRNGR
jgi:3-hydroxyisobutyrate dehydrogenase-like beta-hydroxyacid dehydrogenase